MEVLDPEHRGIDLFDENWKTYLRNSGMTEHEIGPNAMVKENVKDGEFRYSRYMLKIEQIYLLHITNKLYQKLS